MKIGTTIKYDGSLYVIEYVNLDNTLELWSEELQIGHSYVSKNDVEVVI